MSDYREITHAIVGSAMRVHTKLRNGFQEVIYQRALAIEMEKRGLGFEREKEMLITYDGHKIGTRRVDFFCRRFNHGRNQSIIKTGRCPFCPSDELFGNI